MKSLRLMLLVLAAGLAHAHDVDEVSVRPEFVSDWFSDATAIEIKIPVGADTYAVRFGPDEFQPAMSTFISRPPSLEEPGVSVEPDRLRLVIVPPGQPGGNGVCNRRSGQAMLFTSTVTPDGHTDALQNLPFCVPYPPSSEALRFSMTLLDQPTVLGEWIPVYLHAWLYSRPDPPREFVPADEAFSVHVYFSTGSSTHIPDEQPPRIPELLELDEVTYTLRDL